MSQESNNFITSDIGIAAYLQLQGFKILSCRRLETGKFHFEFEIPTINVKWPRVFRVNFCKFDNNVRNLKKILFS